MADSCDVLDFVESDQTISITLIPKTVPVGLRASFWGEQSFIVIFRNWNSQEAHFENCFSVELDAVHELRGLHYGFLESLSFACYLRNHIVVFASFDVISRRVRCLYALYVSSKQK